MLTRTAPTPAPPVSGRPDDTSTPDDPEKPDAPPHNRTTLTGA
ncbi:hypothetical protein [Gluconobacter potus]|nr:hypothetical protein [Gluconobacter potus]